MENFVVYIVDKNDTIQYVNSAWEDFAKNNGAAGLNADWVIGKSIWPFIQGPEMQQLYRHCFENVRCSKKGVQIPCRCDSPNHRRFINLEILPLDASGLEIRCLLIKEEERSEVPVFSNEIRRDKQSFGMCSVCNRVHISSVGWVEVEEAVGRLNMLSDYWLPSLTPTVCEDCHQVLERPAEIK